MGNMAVASGTAGARAIGSHLQRLAPLVVLCIAPATARAVGPARNSSRPWNQPQQLAPSRLADPRKSSRRWTELQQLATLAPDATALAVTPLHAPATSPAVRPARNSRAIGASRNSSRRRALAGPRNSSRRWTRSQQLAALEPAATALAIEPLTARATTLAVGPTGNSSRRWSSSQPLAPSPRTCHNYCRRSHPQQLSAPRR